MFLLLVLRPSRISLGILALLSSTLADASAPSSLALSSTASSSQAHFKGEGLSSAFDGATHLPYVCAIVKEVLRWRPPVELGPPHMAAEDDCQWYEGMLIPKGATCMANIWQCNHDGAIFG
jgi:cytochrome P450